MYDTLVLGAGQAGLAVGYYLKRARLSFALLESSAAPTGSWPQYYESLRLFSPARYSSLPGYPFPGDPHRYPLRDEVSAYLQSYAVHFQLPIIFHQHVSCVEQAGAHFQVVTTTGDAYQARTVIAATGPFHQPHMPSFLGQDLFQGQILHAGAYCQPDPFRNQRVVVVGSGNSAVQIGVELAQVAQMTLTSRQPVRFVPQRPLGQDVHFWMWLLGVDRLAWPSLWQRSQSNPVLDAGRYQAAMKQSRPDWRPLFERLTSTGVVWADGREEEIDAIILATGYRFQPDYLAPLLKPNGLASVQHHKGRSLTVPGLFYMGLSYQRTYASATLRGAGPDATRVVRKIQRFLQNTSAQEKK
ncbi:MAG TPA: NAD(P)/FAD-dependent oxidoreductase [Ktedonobacteraceae bacterium]